MINEEKNYKCAFIKQKTGKRCNQTLFVYEGDISKINLIIKKRCTNCKNITIIKPK